MLQVSGLDHVVLLVADAERALDWYSSKLGLRPERLDEWRSGDVPFVSVRIDERTLIDLIEGERTGVNVDHVSLMVDDAVDLQAAAESGEFDVVSGPMRIWGAQGHGLGLYVRDPDGNTVELKSYGSA